MYIYYVYILYKTFWNLIWIKFEIDLKIIYIEVTRYLLEEYAARKLAKYLKSIIIHYINKPQCLVRLSLVLIVRLRLLLT